MFENGILNLAAGISIFWAILVNAKIRDLRGTSPYAPEIVIAAYSLALGLAVILRSYLTNHGNLVENCALILVLLPYACVLAGNNEYPGKIRRPASRWLVAALVLIFAYVFLGEADPNAGYGGFLSDALITLFFGFGFLMVTGFQRILLLLSIIIWSSINLSVSIAFSSALSLSLAIAAFIRIAFIGRSTVFDTFDFSAEDFINSNVHPFIILDLSGRIVYANTEFIEFSGFSASELVNAEAIDFFEIPNNWMLKIDPRAESKKVRCFLIGKNGQRIPILLWLNEIRKNNKNLVNLVCFIYDESEHQRMRDKINEEARRFAGLHETSKALSSSLEMRDVLEAIAEAAETLTDSDTCTVFALDHSRQMIKALYSTEEVYSDEVMGFEFPVGQGLTGRAVGEGRPLLQNFDDENDLAVLIPGTSDEEESILSAPLLAKNVVIGALTLYKAGGKKFDKENLETLTVFASQAASALETSRLYMKLKESEKVYRASVDLAGDGIMFVNSETGRITDANETIRNMLDYSRAEIVSRYIWELHPQPQMQTARQFWQSVRANGRDALSEIEYETNNKKIIPASVNASTISTGDLSFIQWVVRDMSEYKKTIDNMAFFHDIFFDLGEPALITDHAGMVCFVNHAMKPFVSADSEAFDYSSLNKIGLRSLGLPALEELWEQAKGKNGLARTIVLNSDRNNRVTRTAHIFPRYDKANNPTHYVWLFYPAGNEGIAPLKELAERV